MSVALPGELGGWRSRTTFVLALSASAVGLGSLWRFAYLAGQYGGGAFVLTYVVCLFLIAVPIMVAEVVIGSHGRGSPVIALRLVSDRSLLTRWWMCLGVLTCITGLLVLAYYVVIAGWSLAYANFMQADLFAAANAQLVADEFSKLVAEPAGQLYWQSLFLLLLFVVASLGVTNGLGMLAWLSVPLMFTLLAMLVMFAFDNGDMKATREFLFVIKWVDFTGESVLVALGHAFFTLGIGVGIGISFGAYAPQRVPIGRSVMAVAVFDTILALLAGLAIFPLIFANNLEPSGGPGLMFLSLPYAFGNIPQGELFGTLFFLLMALVALTSAVAMLEPAVGAIIQWLRIGRPVAAAIACMIVWLVSMAAVTSMSSDSPQPWFGYRDLMVLLDKITAAILLPLVSLLTVVLVGWRLRPELLREQLGRESEFFVTLWRILLRYFVPPAIILIMVAALNPQVI